ncbi:ClC family H(+)/Cl(-) exchange transporter [Alloscardovia criceti]|uniref:ClC family H(+)/Cl(-) exchange transporter n=1 Tax=Alloscardovia criceti TaxID=356828 RepID=UPI000375B24B|nr:ClC family H(+)/Cl(-) exchange transporter [Alloscardovia criceti]
MAIHDEDAEHETAAQASAGSSAKDSDYERWLEPQNPAARATANSFSSSSVYDDIDDDFDLESSTSDQSTAFTAHNAQSPDPHTQKQPYTQNHANFVSYGFPLSNRNKRPSSLRSESTATPATQFARRKNYRTHLQELMSGSSSHRWSVALRGIMCGIAAGLLALAYRALIGYGNTWAVTAYTYIRTHPWSVLLWLAIAALSSWIITKLVQWEPMASGSGIPQVEGVLLWGLKMRWWSVLFVRFTAGVLCGFFGMSLGREGPSIQIGAASASAISSRMSTNTVEKDNYVTAGAAAGLSAAFSAPLSGVMFSLEEVYRSFNPLVLLTATTAALTADLLSKLVFGFTPVLQFAHISALDAGTYVWLIPLGIISGLVGAAMNKMLLGMQTLFNRIPTRWRMFVSLAIALAVGVAFPLALGGGAQLVQLAQTGAPSLAFLALILLIKMLFTSTSFGSGAPGGIFLPILAVGAVAGSLCARILDSLSFVHFSSDKNVIITFAMLAMAGTLSSSVKAPITSLLLVSEMTGSFIHMFPVAVVTFTALFVADQLKIKPIYHELLNRYMASHAKPQQTTPTEQSGILSLPVELGSVAMGKKVGDIAWPEDMSLIAIRRGGQEFVPQSSTVIHPGDGVVVLFSGKDQMSARQELGLICLAAY